MYVVCFPLSVSQSLQLIPVQTQLDPSVRGYYYPLYRVDVTIEAGVRKVKTVAGKLNKSAQTRDGQGDKDFDWDGGQCVPAYACHYEACGFM